MASDSLRKTDVGDVSFTFKVLSAVTSLIYSNLILCCQESDVRNLIGTNNLQTTLKDVVSEMKIMKVALNIDYPRMYLQIMCSVIVSHAFPSE